MQQMNCVSVTEWDEAQDEMAIWGCVFHSGPPCLCLCLGKHGHCSAQAAAAAVAAHGHYRHCKAKFTVTRDGLMTGSQSTQTSLGTLRLCNHLQNCVESMDDLGKMFSCDCEGYIVCYCQVFSMRYQVESVNSTSEHSESI